MKTAHDPYNLKRFTDAQTPILENILCELRNGKKETHWMWFVFPQLKSLGSSHNATFYGIESLDEAAAYLEHPVLGPRLELCCEILLKHVGMSAFEILSTPDDMKLQSSMTLFSQIPTTSPTFTEVLDKYFNGILCSKTVEEL